MTTQSILEQARGSIKSTRETCRFRRHRPRPQIGTATIGRREVGIPGILHRLTIRNFSHPTTDRVCRQTHLPQDMFEHVQFTRTVCSRAHSLTTRTRVAQERTAQDRVRWCVKRTRPLQRHVSSLAARSLSPTSPIFQPLPAQIHGGVADPLKSYLPHEEEGHD